MKPLQIFLTEDQHMELKLLAANKGVSMTDLVKNVVFKLPEKSEVPTSKDLTKKLERAVAKKVRNDTQVAKALHQGLGYVCKIHGVPLDSRGKCLQKGCK